MDIKNFIRKPLVVEAIQVTSANFDEVAEWCSGKIELSNDPRDPNQKWIHVTVIRPETPRHAIAFVSDWVLKSVQGFKVYTAKAFQAAFDEMTEDGTIQIRPAATSNGSSNGSNIPKPGPKTAVAGALRDAQEKDFRKQQEEFAKAQNES